MRVGDAKVGLTVGRLEITRLYDVTGGNGRPRKTADCMCRCGTVVTGVLVRRLGDGRSSCGCAYQRSGLTTTPEGRKCLDAARHAFARCTDPDHPKWKAWGAAGVRFMYPSVETAARHWLALGLGKPGTCIDRRNPFGHYSKSNCRVVDPDTSRRNTRKAARRESERRRDAA